MGIVHDDATLPPESWSCSSRDTDTLKAQSNNARPLAHTSPQTAGDREVDLNTLLRMPLDELVRRGGAKSGAEVINYEYSGDQVLDKRGRDLSIIVWRNPGEEEIQGLSISHMKHGVAREVWQYSPAGNIDPETQKFMRQKLAEAYSLLVTPDSFDEGISLLQGVRRLGKMKELKFNPGVQRFALSDSAMFNQERAVGELRTWLKFRGVKVGAIDSNPGKKLPDLANEIRRGETELSVEGGAVLLSSTVVLMEVVHRDSRGVLQRVVETVQRFDNGFEQARRTFAGVPGEKQLRGESAEDTVMRGLQEELGIRRVNSVTIGSPSQYLEESSYPGLFERKHYVPVRVTVPQSEVRPNYQERTEPKEGIAGKWTFMEWQPVLEPRPS